ncbi:methylated-DNA--[protein]-cysteine S-methyltransferase [Chromobacterium piscinae]|uniref:methylated-DNA--[protein]-cysteine S-methyltransferase n=1 Tax=Chromobacterium piscinae TaxID=686831 RepID=UPI001C8C077B|nr:methylated-DNA--[protein]-cysteine S-methyltransferase [Chromobacterium piscinae]MBX9295978.1 methylated-DNA--[protein]-cysteine S-methyltransferase [Chromobacterium vaccinii]MBX9356639.1 methylated-DNA--[protein]-cysteine S-methyltransferase [Chromobacterium vaccinii]MCD4502665.1 methylated-DNA--[protein]-cysteine S-methyltransferase [Chromobacterium piscinae]
MDAILHADEEAGRDYARVRDAIRYLVAHAGEQPQLADVAAALCLSESRLQRLFSRWAGVSPKRFIQQLTCEAAKARLAAGAPLLPLSHELGLSGSSRLHDLFVTLEAMTPGEYQQGGAGLDIVWSVEPSRFGPVLLAQTARGVCALQFLADDDEAEAWLRAQWPRAALRHLPGHARALCGRLFDPLSEADGSPLALRVQGSNFQIQVWRALLAVPYGGLLSYGQLAEKMGRPGAARAVGNAVGANPVAWLIPCHRVIRAEGALGGYRWGEERKLDLIGWESARLSREEATA